jgi:hypothetical protein
MDSRQMDGLLSTFKAAIEDFEKTGDVKRMSFVCDGFTIRVDIAKVDRQPEMIEEAINEES